MSQRPTIAPGVLAAIISAAPERLQKKLDREPRVADDWKWEHADGQWMILAGEETVRIPAGTITEVIQVQCSCLLSPRCFHVLAVLNVAEISIEDQTHAGEANANDSIPGSMTESGAIGDNALSTSAAEIGLTGNSVALTIDQTRAARLMFDACAAILTTGLRASGAVLQSRLLRSIHECRAVGLHRVAAGGLRLMSNLRFLREGNDQFSSVVAEEDLRDVLETCLRLERAASSAAGAGLEWIGVARRNYEPIQSLKLHGLFCEPIVTRSGYSGVVTWLMAEDGWIGTVSDVQPGTSDRIPQAWRSGVSLAGLSISHRDLSRKCLLISKATRSIDGRMGGGESARAVTIDGQGWDAPPISQRFKMPLMQQIRRVFSDHQGTEFLRPAGTDLVFFSAIVLGYSGLDLIVREHETGAILRLSILIDSDNLAFRSSLKTLARAPGLSIRCIGRIELTHAGRMSLLAVSAGATFGQNSTSPDSNDVKSVDPNPEDVHSQLPKFVPLGNQSVFSIGMEEISRASLTAAQSNPVAVPVSDEFDSVSSSNYDECLERWLRAIAVGGRHAIPQGLVSSAVRDANRLRSNLRPTAASLLNALTQSTISTRTDLAGIRFAEDPVILAEKWLAAAIGSRTTLNYMQMQQWLKMLDSA